jgi:hypothetical protein
VTHVKLMLIPISYSYPYSPKCLEVDFSEVRIQHPAYPRPDRLLRARLSASVPRGGGLHVVVLDRYSLG